MITNYFKDSVEGSFKTPIKVKPGCWTHVVKPTHDEREEITKQFKLEPTIVEDSQDMFEVPRLEKGDGINYFFVRYLYNVEEAEYDTAPLLVVIGKSFILTIAEQEVPFLDAFLEGKRTFNSTKEVTFFFEIMSELIVEYEYHLVKVRKSVNRNMTRVRNISPRDIQQSVIFEQELNETISALVHTQAWLKQLEKGKYLNMTEDEQELLSNLLVDNGQILDSANTILKTIQNIRGASEAILTQNLNTTIKMLTAVTIILTIPTLISSLFGMNVILPFEGVSYGFWAIVSAIVSIVVVTVFFFVRNRWL